jgi:hypothetical protein
MTFVALSSTKIAAPRMPTALVVICPFNVARVFIRAPAMSSLDKPA